MTWPISYSREMVPFGEIKDARKCSAVTCFQSLFQLRISIPVSVIADARAEPPSRFDQRDLESGAGQNVCGDTAPRPAPNDAYIKNLFRHRLAAITNDPTGQRLVGPEGFEPSTNGL